MTISTVQEELKRRGFAHTRARDLAHTAAETHRAVCKLDMRHLEKAHGDPVGRAFLTIARFFGRHDGPGTRHDFGPISDRDANRLDSSEEITEVVP